MSVDPAELPEESTVTDIVSEAQDSLEKDPEISVDNVVLAMDNSPVESTAADIVSESPDVLEKEPEISADEVELAIDKSPVESAGEDIVSQLPDKLPEISVDNSDLTVDNNSAERTCEKHVSETLEVPEVEPTKKSLVDLKIPELVETAVVSEAVIEEDLVSSYEAEVVEIALVSDAVIEEDHVSSSLPAEKEEERSEAAVVSEAAVIEEDLASSSLPAEKEEEVSEAAVANKAAVIEDDPVPSISAENAAEAIEAVLVSEAVMEEDLVSSLQAETELEGDEAAIEEDFAPSLPDAKEAVVVEAAFDLPVAETKQSSADSPVERPRHWASVMKWASGDRVNSQKVKEAVASDGSLPCIWSVNKSWAEKNGTSFDRWTNTAIKRPMQWESVMNWASGADVDSMEAKDGAIGESSLPRFWSASKNWAEKNGTSFGGFVSSTAMPKTVPEEKAESKAVAPERKSSPAAKHVQSVDEKSSQSSSASTDVKSAAPSSPTVKLDVASTHRSDQPEKAEIPVTQDAPSKPADDRGGSLPKSKATTARSRKEVTIAVADSPKVTVGPDAAKKGAELDPVSKEKSLVNVSEPSNERSTSNARRRRPDPKEPKKVRKTVQIQKGVGIGMELELVDLVRDIDRLSNEVRQLKEDGLVARSDAILKEATYALDSDLTDFSRNRNGRAARVSRLER
jgi:hypothetical protein